MKILIIGGTGFIGSALSREVAGSGGKVFILTRRSIYPASPQENIRFIQWNPPALIPPDIISGIDAVINLAGESIFGRWTKKQKDLIRSSRIDTTSAVVKSIKNAGQRPRLLISASAVGYYGSHGDEYVTEDTPPGDDFLSVVGKIWEAEALKAEELGVRVVLMRLGIVLERDGGALPKVALPFKFFSGGPVGSGRQWFSWIHRDDVLGIIKFLLEDETISGAVNATAPNPVRNREFSSTLGRALHRPSWLPVPAIILKIALGEFGDVILQGQRVISERLLKAGYKFKYPNIDEALKAIFEKNGSRVCLN